MLQELETRGVEFEIHIPVDTITVTSSFFGGMFGPSIRSLGETEFRRRFSFTGKDISRVIGRWDSGSVEGVESTPPHVTG
jgi:hypothetical protein